METAVQLGVPLLGRLPLDPELARRCDAGEVEAYATQPFEPIAEKIVAGIPATKTVPIFT
jgi:hypothetical protein